MLKTETIACILDDSRGVYIPLKFATNLDMTEWHVDADDVTILRAGPDHEGYWETWDSVLGTAYWIDSEDGRRWTLYQDGDLFAMADNHCFNHADLYHAGFYHR